MNKVVNVNLGGYVLVLEEPAFELLKQYLERLAQHFAGKEGATEIIADIETRIAELLLQRISNPTQAIVLEQAREVIGLLGEPWQMDEQGKEASQSAKRRGEPGKLHRDPNSRVLGGVCSGIAAYLGLDTTLVRLLFAVAFFVFGSGFLLYIILWVAIPAGNASDFQPDEHSKKLFRDPDQATLGGVCSGLGYFFGIDAVWFKVAFLLSFFLFGGGLLLYILLWIAVPKASTTSDRLRMRGEPIDVSNIEKVVSNTAAQAGKNLNKAGNFLTDLFTILLNFAGKIIGFVLVTAGIAASIAWIMVLTLKGETKFSELISFFIPDALTLNLFTAGSSGVIFSIALLCMLTGIRLWKPAALRIRYLFSILSVISILGWITLGVATAHYIYDVHEEGSESQRSEFEITRDTIYLSASNRLNREQSSGFSVGSDRHSMFAFESLDNDSVWLCNQELIIEAQKGKPGSMEITREARGNSKTSALHHAQRLSYNVQPTDSGWIFDQGFILSKPSGFHFEEVTIRLYLPAGTVVVADQKICDMLHLRSENPVNGGRMFEVTRKGLVCLDCSDEESFNDEWENETEEVSIKLHHGDESEQDSVNITIRKNDDHEKTEKTTIEIKDGKRVKTEVHKNGPVTIKKTEVIEQEDKK